jgi:hypothetical protein
VRFDLLEVGLQRLGGGQLLASQPARQHPCRQPARSIAPWPPRTALGRSWLFAPFDVGAVRVPSTVPSPRTGASPSNLPCQSGPLRCCCVSRQPVAAPTPAHAAPTTPGPCSHSCRCSSCNCSHLACGLPRLRVAARQLLPTRSAHAGTLAVRAAQAHRVRPRRRGVPSRGRNGGPVMVPVRWDQ